MIFVTRQLAHPSEHVTRLRIAGTRIFHQLGTPCSYFRHTEQPPEPVRRVIARSALQPATDARVSQPYAIGRTAYEETARLKRDATNRSSPDALAEGGAASTGRARRVVRVGELRRGSVRVCGAARGADEKVGKGVGRAAQSQLVIPSRGTCLPRLPAIMARIYLESSGQTALALGLVQRRNHGRTRAYPTQPHGPWQQGMRGVFFSGIEHTPFRKKFLNHYS
jgi:hypothetical protein